VKSRLKLFQDQTSTKQFRPATQCSTILLNLLRQEISNHEMNIKSKLNKTFGQTDIWTDRHLDRQTFGQPASQTDRQTDEQID